MPAPAEDLPVSVKHDIYPFIDPQQTYTDQTFKGKVVLVTGASRGIGEEIAVTYARAGASVVLLARRPQGLDEVKAAIERRVPGAQVLTVPTDVTRSKEVGEAVKAAVDRFGRIDVCVANAGTASPWDRPFAERDADEWWGVMEVNFRGVYNIAHFATPHLAKTKGYLLAVSSTAAQSRIPYSSAYSVSKHATGRFLEFVQLEYPDVKVFSVHPGTIKTDMVMDNNPQWQDAAIDTTRLAACTILYLTTGKADWLAGKFVSANWDLQEVIEGYKDKIIESDALVNRFHVPL
ncbi:hypothetical protein EW146_g8284 [Bondarzewia mesenterica]|uniref:Ketoreductase domain-containing protein n=1 Tax=Bondarzewia mesenterica TaxID=1095465 RepID=A0A4S4LGA3_9AGAM|nr:hypothetical protein EW146_g8284 [Bondarzewia mesenterica]